MSWDLQVEDYVVWRIKNCGMKLESAHEDIYTLIRQHDNVKFIIDVTPDEWMIIHSSIFNNPIPMPKCIVTDVMSFICSEKLSLGKDNKIE